MSIGNLKDSGNQGNNFPWQLKVLQGLQAIFDEVAQPLTCVEDSVTICNANIDAFTFTNIGGNDALNVNIAGGVTLEVNLDAANDQVGIYGYNGTTPTPVSVDSNGFVNTNASITFPSSLAVTQDPASDPWTVDATDLDIRDLTFATDSVDVTGSDVTVSNTVDVTATDLDIRDLTFATDSVDVSGSNVNAVVTATALDIRALDCGTDSVSICDGTNNLAIDLNGSISSNLYANDLVSGSPELVTTTGGVGYQALDVNVVAPINTITPNILSVTDSGVIAPAVYSITFFNSGPDDELISFDGGTTPVVLSPGVSITMDAGGIANKYPAGVFAYDVIGTGPIVITYNS
jgi:hypothetical protein